MSSRKQQHPISWATFLVARPTGQPLARSRPAEPPAPPKPLEWEYREVVFRDYRGWRARMVNGRELGDWKTSPTIVEYLEKAGSEGWELGEHERTPQQPEGSLLQAPQAMSTPILRDFPSRIETERLTIRGATGRRRRRKLRCDPRVA